MTKKANSFVVIELTLLIIFLSIPLPQFFIFDHFVIFHHFQVSFESHWSPIRVPWIRFKDYSSKYEIMKKLKIILNSRVSFTTIENVLLRFWNMYMMFMNWAYYIRGHYSKTPFGHVWKYRIWWKSSTIFSLHVISLKKHTSFDVRHNISYTK